MIIGFHDTPTSHPNATLYHKAPRPHPMVHGSRLLAKKGAQRAGRILAFLSFIKGINQLIDVILVINGVDLLIHITNLFINWIFG